MQVSVVVFGFLFLSNFSIWKFEFLCLSYSIIPVAVNFLCFHV